MDKDLMIRDGTASQGELEQVVIEEVMLPKQKGFWDRGSTKLVAIALIIAIALGSFFGLGPILSDPATYEGTVTALDDKKATVMELTAATTATSVAIAAIPGDATTPIADKLMDLSSWYVVIIAVIIVEKYLLILMGKAAALVVIPLACLMIGLFVITKRKSCGFMGAKLIVFALTLVLIMPTSVYVSGLLQETYDATIQTTISTSNDISDIMEGDDKTAETQGETSKEDSKAENSEKSPLDWLKDKVTGLKDSAEGAVDTITSGVTGSVDKLKAVLNQFIEMVAILIVVNCVMPILVITFFFWVVKMIFGFDFNSMASLSAANKAISGKGKTLNSGVKSMISKKRGA